MADASGGWGAIGFGGAFATTGPAGASGGFSTTWDDVLAITGMLLVAVNAGALFWCEIGVNSSSSSGFSGSRNTFADGLATTIRGGSATGLTLAVAATGGGAPTPGLGTTFVAGRLVSAGVPGVPIPAPGATGFFCGKRGVVLAWGGAPLSEGAKAFGGTCGSVPEGGRVTFAIGFVTAAAHAGGTCGASKRTEVLIGSVVAAEILGLGVIFVEAGFIGLGGRLMRRVSRFGAFGSEPSGGVAGSAIMFVFIVISENVQWRNS
jgi:hypothetical protein